MKKALAAIGIVALAAALAYVTWLNPVPVEFRFAPEQRLTLQLGLLLIGAFFAGVLVTVLGGSTLQLARSLRRWPERRQERHAVRVTEWERAGTALTWDGELDRARNLLLKAWRRQPHNSAAAIALASSYTDTGELEAARRILQEAMSRDASDPDLRLALSQAMERGGELPEAIRILETVRVQHPRAQRALLRLRDLYCRAGRWKEAAEVQAAYVDSLPSSADARSERELLIRLRYQAALAVEDPAARAEALSLILQLDRNFFPAVVSLGDALAESQKLGEAMKLWERTFKQMPRLVLVERMLSHQSSPGDRSRAVALLRKYRPQPPESDGTQVIAARLALGDGDLDTASAELSAVQRQDAPPVQRLWAEIYRRRQQHDRAVEALAQVADQTAAALAAGYRCATCGRAVRDWAGYCPGCNRWDTYRSVADLSAS